MVVPELCNIWIKFHPKFPAGNVQEHFEFATGTMTRMQQCRIRLFYSDHLSSHIDSIQT